jgi:acetyl-CoA carboxylase biotin carboxyl carrier protein
MTFDEIKQVLDLVREHGLAEFELEQEGVKLRVRRENAAQAVGTSLATPAIVPALLASANPGFVVPAGPQSLAGSTGPPLPAAPEDEDAIELAVVKSPIVGTFYRAPDPSAPPFVEINQPVRKGQVLCIIEAMKLMNEIESEYEGEVVKVYVENGQPVQFGERLFAIRTV